MWTRLESLVEASSDFPYGGGWDAIFAWLFG